MSYVIGVNAGYEALEHRQHLAPLMEGALRGASSPGCGGAMMGLVEVLATAIDKLNAADRLLPAKSEAARLIIDAMPAARRLHLVALCRQVHQDVADVLSELTSAVYSHRDALHVVETVSGATERIMRVQVVEMPTRLKTQTVLRNDKGEIMGSETVEQDQPDAVPG